MFNQNGAEMWRKMLTENFNVTDSEKLNWVSEYASVHEIHESALGVNAAATNSVIGAPVAPLYANPMNTTGMGNPYAPAQMPVDSTKPAHFANQAVGSGDIPVSTLPMALNVALLTIGLELVPVIPAKGPWAMLSYMDFPYAGGKLGRVNETSFDGKGEGTENKPIYVKAAGLSLATIAAIREAKPAEGAAVTVVGKVKVGEEVKDATFNGKFLGFGRMDGAPMFKVVDCAGFSLREVFEGATAVCGVTLTDKDHCTADFVQTSVDLVDGFANFATGGKEAMTRAQNETGTGNVIGLRLFSKWIQMGSYEVTGTVTRQQLQDLPLYGVDAVGKVMEALQNEITQHINARILERVFALGVTNAAKLKYAQGIDLNLYLGAAKDAKKQVKAMTSAKMLDIYENEQTWEVANQEALTSAENTHTRQRRLSSRILAAANIIQTVGRRGRATWVVVNSQIASALQDCAGYVVAPMVNNMAQDGSQNLFLGGTLAGLKVYVDPYMAWDDTRICVGRKGDGNSPGVIFMPYILADTVSITAEGTMAPKMLVNSRYAIAEAGFFPETQYLTFCAFNDFGWI